MSTDFIYDATITRVYDGDSVFLDIDLGFETWIKNREIRFLGINAPELNTPEGKAAQVYLVGLMPVGTKVTLVSDKDRADKFGGRWLGTIFLADGTNVNQLMVTSGHAKNYDGHGPKPV